MEDGWYVRLVDFFVDPAYTPQTEAASDIYWERDCDCWRDLETKADAEAVYSIEKECWVNAEDEKADCVPLMYSVPKPIWNSRVDDWMDQYDSYINE